MASDFQNLTPELLAASVAERFPSLAIHVVPPPHGASPHYDGSGAGTTPLIRFASATHDSRMVEAGSLFCCVRGGAFDGHRFAQEAVARGCVALLVDHVLPGVNATQLVVKDTRLAIGPVSAALAGYPADQLVLVGVTGTNGKTTTAHMLTGILQAHGKETAVLGTLTQKRTTPEATDLQRTLAGFVESKITHVVMEVTSHALDLHRVDGIVYDTAVFTNLSHDHLDFHETMESYFRAKAKLFEPRFARRAVVNVDDPHGHLLRSSHVIPTESFCMADAHDVALESSRSTFWWRGVELVLPVAGAFNVMNALGAATTAEGLGVDPGAIASGLSHAKVPGRYEAVNAGQPFAIVVDFAHTPDGLERLLLAARSTIGSGGRLLTVFGCGGDRDRTKRPLMGDIASAISDITIVTSDNPRTEAPATIIAEIVGGLRGSAEVRVIEDRRAAIDVAIREARPNDVVMIAGKGHEEGQTIGGVTYDFDDRVVARSVLAELGFSENA